MHKTDANFKAVIRRFEDQPISTSQLKFVRDLMEKKNITVDDIIMDGFPPLEKLTKGLASELIEYLMNQKERELQSRNSGGTERLSDLLDF